MKSRHKTRKRWRDSKGGHLSFLQVVGLEETRSRGGWRGARWAHRWGSVTITRGWSTSTTAVGWSRRSPLLDNSRRSQGHLERQGLLGWRIGREPELLRRGREGHAGRWERSRSERKWWSTTGSTVRREAVISGSSWWWWWVATRHRQRIRISGGLEEVSGEHWVRDGPGERETLTFVLHATVLEPDFDGGLL